MSELSPGAEAAALATPSAPDATPATTVGETPAPAQIDKERQKLARHYARQQQTLSLIGLGASGVLIALLLFSGLSFWLRDAVAFTPNWTLFGGWQPARVGAFFLALFLAAFVLGLPLSWYGGFILAHRYGLSTQSLRGWLIDEAKGFILSLVFELAAIEGLYLLLAALPTTWWLWGGLAMAIVIMLLSTLLPVLVLPLFFKLTPLPDGEVRQRTLLLADRAHTRVRGIYSMNMSARTTAANAMVAGLGGTRRIVIGDTLLDRYTPDEIEVVVAHELGHQVHNDIPKLVLVQVVTTLVGLFIVNLVLNAVVSNVHQYHGLTDSATLPLIVATLGVFGLVLLPLVNGYSRHVEHQADVYALESTGKIAAFLSAMTRLANQNLGELQPSPIVEFLLYNHPSIGKRLAFARAYAERQEQKSQA
ncbi:MAG: M48 family metallopeptidase [Ktedonobacterales bacterium]